MKVQLYCREFKSDFSINQSINQVLFQTENAHNK